MMRIQASVLPVQRIKPARFTVHRWQRVLIAGVLIIVLVVGGTFGGMYWVMAQTAGEVDPAPIEVETTRFDGRYLIAASDADMVGTAYADGILRQIPGDVDTLTLVELPLESSAANHFEIPISNSVTSWPQIIAASPDGQTLYVVETAGQVADDVEQLATANFPIGRLLSVIDLSEGAESAQVRTVEVGNYPIHIGISTDGEYLAVGLRERDRQLAILPTKSLDDPSSFRYFAIHQSNGEPSEEVTSVAWHPSGNFLAVGNDSRELQFYRVSYLPEGVTLTPHGERLSLGNTMTYGQFTSNGNYYLTAEINWETVPAPLGSLVNPPGEMISVRFDVNGEHSVVSRVEVGLSPEGFAVSPQEDLIVTVNMRRTYLPDELAATTPGGDINSLSLVSFDSTTGLLEVLGEEYGFEGVLPEQAVFDADGDALAVVVYNFREDPMTPGIIEFWNVERNDDTPRLVRTAVQIPVVRGPHAVYLIP